MRTSQHQFPAHPDVLQVSGNEDPKGAQSTSTPGAQRTQARECHAITLCDDVHRSWLGSQESVTRAVQSKTEVSIRYQPYLTAIEKAIPPRGRCSHEQLCLLCEVRLARLVRVARRCCSLTACLTAWRYTYSNECALLAYNFHELVSKLGIFEIFAYRPFPESFAGQICSLIRNRHDHRLISVTLAYILYRYQVQRVNSHHSKP